MTTASRTASRPDRVVLPGERLRRRIRRGDSYVLVLILLTVDYFVISLAGQDRWTWPLTTAITGTTLVATLRTSRVPDVLMRTAEIAALACFWLVLLGSIVGQIWLAAATGWTMFALLVSAPVAIVTRIIRHRRVTVETIAGAVDVYLLIGLVFSSVYRVIDIVTPFFAQTAHATYNQFLYFSFVTLATLGYGDLTPGTDVGRSLIVVEAMLGQVFLVTVVARLVALLGTEQRRRSPDQGEGGSPDEG